MNQEEIIDVKYMRERLARLETGPSVRTPV